MIGAVLAGRLLETQAVTALIQDRVYPKRIPQGKPLPAVRFDVEPKSSIQHCGGVTNVRQDRVRFTVEAADYKTAQAVATAIAAALDGFQGTIGATRIGHCLQMSSAPETFDPQEGQDGGNCADAREFDCVYYV